MRILIIGAGDIGFQLAKQLSQQNHDITMIEADPRKVTRASEQLDAFVVSGNGASYNTLQRADLANTEIVAAMTDRDEVNLMACRIAKRSGIPTTIARVRNPQFTTPGFILTPDDLGVDLLLHPEKETADAIIQLLHQSHAEHAVEFEAGRVKMLGVRLEKNSPLLDISLIELTKKYHNPPMRVIAINRNHRTVVPHGHSRMQAGDEVFIVCDRGYATEFIRLAGKRDAPVRDVMILGGGLISHFIAQSMSRHMNIKIVEQRQERAEQLSEMLPRTLVIHGDGTDFDLLHQEGLTEMDAFVAVTGDDANNVITTLLAQHSNVPRAIAMINKSEYISIAPRIGMDSIVSKQLLTVDAVQRYIQQKSIASYVTLPGINAELIEYIATEGCKITSKPIKRLHFPKEAVIGIVVRGEKLIIPYGDTQIAVGDKVIVFTLPQVLPEVDKFFSHEQRRIDKLYEMLSLG